ncbi:dTDP-4-dehydrorhamnose 3,5-epimerase family protein [Streptomyces sp. NPDC006668]|uniref:dTDP-4-dehydrorhamnose 3,5-epimerase family protein n=1 Tax=Streptomyces sp. NPDC006668 TaxID=3156903 RepID=UPI0033FE2B73
MPSTPADTGLPQRPNAFVQDSVSRSVRGVLRGLHLRSGAGGAKLVRCSYGQSLAGKEAPDRACEVTVDLDGVLVIAHCEGRGGAEMDHAAGRPARRTRPGHRRSPDHGETLLALPDPGPPAPQAPKLPDHPAYQQIMAVFIAADHPLRARQVCEAMDVAVTPNNINNVRLKLERLAGRGILAETGPGVFTQPRP